MNRVPTLIGIGGPFNGEVFPLEQNRPAVVGRSRQADISVKRTQRYKLQSEIERDQDQAAKTISARHFQITCFNPQSVEIKNLSVNGTHLDGKPVGAAVIVTDLATQSHEIAFGTDAKFRLALTVN